jgi:hypothetical protein
MSIITIVRCDNCGTQQDLQAAAFRCDVGFMPFGMNPDGGSRHLCTFCYKQHMEEFVKKAVEQVKP